MAPNKYQKLFTKEDSVVVFIDHQPQVRSFTSMTKGKSFDVVAVVSHTVDAALP